MVFHSGCKLSAHLRGHEAVGNSLLFKIPVQSHQIQADALIDDVDAGTGGQGRIQVHHICVKAIACIRSHPGFGLQAIIFAVPIAERSQIAVLQHTSFGHAGGAGGVKQDKQIFRCRVLFNCFTGRKGWDIPGQEHLPLIALHQRKKIFVRNQKLGTRILHHERQTLLGIGGVKGLVGGSRFQHTQRSDDHVFTPGNQDRNHILPANAL